MGGADTDTPDAPDVLAGTGFSARRSDPHAGHHGAYSLTPNPLTFAPQQVAQHPGFGKLSDQITRVDPAHQLPIRCGQRTRLRVGAQPSRFDECAFSTIMLQGQLANLGVKDRKVGHIRRSLCIAKYDDGPRQQVLFPFRDLGGMQAKWCRQLHTASCR